MDIPVPKKSEKATEPVAVAEEMASAPVQESPVAPATSVTEPAKETPQEPSNVIELIQSKKYVLTIKEKRTSPLITFGFAAKPKDRKSKRSTKKSKPAQTKETKATKKGQGVKVAVLLLLVVGVVLAIDMGYLDIGVKLPFTLIGPR